MTDEPKAEVLPPVPLRRQRRSRAAPISRFDATALLANITIGLAAVLYSIGMIYRNYLFAQFGLPVNALSLSLQQTMVEGYSALIVSSAIPFVAALIGFGILQWWRYRRMKKHGPRHYNPRLRRVTFLSMVAYLIICLVGIAFLVGFPAAGRQYAIVMRSLDGGCKKCFLYVANRGQVVGVPIAQDDKQILIATRSGVTILPAGSLKAVRPINKRHIIPRWMYITSD